MSSMAILGITAAIELIKFVQTSRDLKDKSAEEVMEIWASTREEVRMALDMWRASSD